MIWNNLGDIRSLGWWWRPSILIRRSWIFMTLIWLHVRSFWRRAIIRYNILSLELLIFILFINWLFLYGMITDPVWHSYLSLFLCILSCRLIIVPLWLDDSLYLTLVQSWTFRNNTFPVFIDLSMSPLGCFGRWFLFICGVIISMSTFVLLSEVRSNADRFIIGLSCLLPSGILRLSRLLLRISTCLLACGRGRWQRTLLISVRSILSLVNLAWLFVLAFDLWKHVACIVSLSPAIFFFQTLLHLLRAFIAWLR